MKKTVNRSISLLLVLCILLSLCLPAAAAENREIPGAETTQQGDSAAVYTNERTGGGESIREATALDDLEEGLVLHSTFDEKDRSETEIKNLRDDTHSGAIAGTVASVPGVKGEAAQIINSGSLVQNYVDYGKKFDELMGTEDFSLSVWIMSANTTNTKTIISNKDGSAARYLGFYVSYGANGDIVPQLSGGSNSKKISLTGMGGQDMEWHHLVVTVNRGGSMIGYLDGQKKAESSLDAVGTENLASGLSFVLGCDGAVKYGSSSTLDELRIYDRAVTAQTAAAIYMAEKTADMPDVPDEPTEPEESLVLYSTFDQCDRTATEIKNLKDSGHKGTIGGTVEFVPGIKGDAIKIDNGGGDAVNHVDYGTKFDDLMGTGNFSIAVWVRTDDTTQGDHAILGNKSWASGKNKGFAFTLYKENILSSFGIGGVSVGSQDIGGKDGSWHHLVVTVDRAGSMTTYLDGVSKHTVSMDTVTTDATSGYPFVLGGDGLKKYSASCTLDELRVYNTAIDAEKVTEIYTKEKPEEEPLPPEPTEPGMVLHSTFDTGDRSATEIFNLEDETHKGTIGGTVDFVPGIRGDAVKIDNGGGDAKNHVDYGTKFDTMMGTENFSIALWVRSDNTNQNDRSVLGNKDWGSGSKKGMTIAYLSGGLQPNFGNGSKRVDNTGVGGQDGAWHHLVLTVDRSGDMVSYLDGQKMSSVSMAALGVKSNLSTGLPFVLGGDGMKHYSATCTVDELRIYNMALTEAEALSVYTQDGGAPVELARIKTVVDGITPGNRYTAEAIAAFKAKLDAWEDELATLTDPADILKLMDTVKAEYETFLEGKAPLAKFIAISDVHSGDYSDRTALFVKAMEDMKEVAPNAIAMLNGGDFGESTASAQEMFFQTMNNNCPYSDEKVIIALGNHDVRVNQAGSWHSNPADPSVFTGWPAIKDRYLRLNKPYMPEGNGDKTYFSKELDGYTFIVLNTELGLKDDLYMSDAQIEWFEATMKAAYEKDPTKPVFVIGHQAMGETHWPNPAEYPFCPQSINADARVKEIMRKYPVATYLSGHLHNGMGYSGIVHTDYGALIDLPSLLQPEGRGYSQKGAGYVAYIYEDEVLWRARNFLTKTWLPEYDITIKMDEMPNSDVTVEDDETAVTYSTGTGKSWTREAPYHAATLGWPTTAETQYPTVSATFDGTGIAVYGHRIANGGMMSVTVDGEDMGMADFYAPLVRYNVDSSSPVDGIYGIQASAKVFEVTGLERGEHTIELTFSNQKNEDAQPGDGMLRAAIDYFKIDYAKGYPAGTTFYVDAQNGDDANGGTGADAPWKTLDMVNALTLKPGDKVLLKAGSVFEGQSLSLRGSGSREKPIVVDMYDGATVGAEAGVKPHIKAGGVAKADFVIGKEGDTGTTSRPNIAYGLHIKNVSHIQVNNLEITNNSGARQLAVGVVVEAESGQGVVSGVHLDGLYVHDVYGTLTEKTAPNGGIYLITTAANGDVAHPTRYDDISVQNCTVSKVSRTGISVGSSHSAYYWERHAGGIIPEDVKDKYGHTNVVIRNNYVEESGGDAIVPQFCVGPLIEYNVSNGASQNTKGNYGAMYNAAIWPWRCEDAVFQFNEAYGTVSNGDGQAYDCDSSRGTTYQYNYSHDNEGGFILLCQSQSIESTVRYNISQNDHDSLFLVSNTTPAEIYNNTFYVGPNLTKIVDGGSPSNLKNNIFYNAGGKANLAGWGNFTYDNNLYYGFDTTPTDAKAIKADPLFVDGGKGENGVAGNSAIDTLSGYALRENSPAINAGTPIANNGGRDYAGNPIEDIVDVGAMEFRKAEEPDDVPVTGVTLDKAAATLTVGGSETLTATVNPTDATNKAVSWTSSDENVATVTGGVVTAVAPGTATITVTTEDGNKTADCTVTVNAAPVSVTGVTLDRDSITLYSNRAGSETLVATVNPTDAANKTVSWTSSDENVAKVADGVVTAVANGTAVITVTTEDGNHTAACTITVKTYTEPSYDPPVSNTTTDTVKNADGSTTKTVTNKKTGDVTITTTYPDGSKIVTTIPKDGETSIRVSVPQGTDTATLTIPTAGKPAPGVVAVIVHADGTEEVVKSSVSTENGLRITISEGAALKLVDNTKKFVDVSKEDWSAKAVAFAASRELFNGTGKDAFSPAMEMTRGMFLTVLYRYSGAQVESSRTTWYSDAQKWAMDTELSDGVGMEDAITREQLVTLLHRYAGKTDSRVGNTDDGVLKSFADYAELSPWSAEAMAWAVSEGIIGGKGSGLLDPSGTATRAEVAAILQRFISR